MHLRIKLALLFAATVAVLLAVGGYVLSYELQTSVDAALDSSLATRADALVQQVGPNGTVSNFQDGGGNTSPRLAGEAIAQVVGPSGAVLESSEGAGTGSLLTPTQLHRARATTFTLTTTARGGESVRLIAQPVTQNHGRPFVVVVGSSRDVATAGLDRLRKVLWLGGPVAVVIAGVGAWLVATTTLRPVERMRSRAAALSGASTSGRLPVPARNDEIGRLGRTFNALLERVQQTMAQQRGFVEDASHELRTPLATLRAELELAVRPRSTAQQMRAAMTSAIGDVDRLTRLGEDLLTLAKSDTAAVHTHPRPVDICAIADRAVGGAQALQENLHIRVVGDRPVYAEADPLRIRQMLDNLLANAAQAGATEVTVDVRHEAAPRSVVLSVRDDGPGFPELFLPRAFDRFARADTARTSGGTGLGLAIVAALAHAHGGTATASNLGGSGAQVQVTLPTVASVHRSDTDL